VDKHYLLPILAMVETMKGSPEVVVLQAFLSLLPGVTKDACLAQVTLGQGRIHSCTITTKTGTVLREQLEAYQALERCGDLNWSVLPASSLYAPASQKATPSRLDASDQPTSRVPSLRVQALTLEILEPLSNPYRRVIRLVDGKRSIEDIARLLNKTPQEVQQMLAALQHLIQF